MTHAPARTNPVPRTAPAPAAEEHALRRSLVVLALAALAGLVVIALPLPGASPWAHRVLAIVAVSLVLWVGEGLGIAVTSMLVIALLAIFGTGTSSEATRAALAGFQLPAGYFILGTLVVAVATVRSGLAARLAHALIASSGGSARRVYLQLIIFMPPFSMLLPSAQTRNAILIPAYEQVYERLNFQRGDTLPKLVSLAMATLQVVASTSVLTGGIVPITSAFLLGGMGWIEWYIYMAVPCYAILLLGGLAFLLWQRPQPPRRPAVTPAPGTKRPERWSSAEIRAGIIIGAMTLLWLGDGWTGWDPLIPALLGSVALFTPGIGVVTWKDFEGTSPWAIFFVTGTALSIANALNSSGAAAWLANGLLDNVPLEEMPLLVALGTMMAAVVPVSIVLPNRAGVLGLVIPLLTSVSMRLGINPIPVGLMATIVCQSTTFYPVQNAASLIAYRPRHFAAFDLVRAGLILFSISAVIIFAVAVPWWALVGLPLRP